MIVCCAASINVDAQLTINYGTGGQRISTARIGDNRYFISSQNPYAPMLNFFLAYQYCRSIAMELVSLENAEEAIALSEYLRSG